MTALADQVRDDPTAFTDLYLFNVEVGYTLDGKKFLLTGHIDHGEPLRSDIDIGKLFPYRGSITTELDFAKDSQGDGLRVVPEGTLWLSRGDGSDRWQLSYPPVHALVLGWGLRSYSWTEHLANNSASTRWPSRAAARASFCPAARVTRLIPLLVPQRQQGSLWCRLQ